MSEIYFSIILYIDDEENLLHSISSLEGALDETKLIIVDPVCSEETMSISKSFQEKYGNNRIAYFKTFGMNMAEAYNVALEEITGRYVNFSLTSIGLTDSALEAVQDAAEDNGRPKLISLSPWTVNEKGEYVQYRMSPAGSKGCELIQLADTPERLQLFFHGYFVRAYLLNSRERHMWFRPELMDDAAPEMLLRLLAEIKKYFYCGNVKLHYGKQIEDNTSAFLLQHYEWWYLNSLKNWLLPFAEEWSQKDWPLRTSMRIALLYFVFVRFNCNYNDRNKMVLDQVQQEEFYRLSGQILQYVDNGIIWKKGSLQNFNIPRTMKIFLLKLKAETEGKKVETLLHGDEIYLWTHGETEETVSSVSRSFVIQKQPQGLPEFSWAYENGELLRVAALKSEHVIISIINYEKGRLEIDGTLSFGDFLENKDMISLKVIKGRRSYPAIRTEAYGLRKLFGRTYEHVYQFHVSIRIPAVTASDTEKMFFVLIVNGEEHILQIRTSMVYAHVTPDVPGQYWRFAEEWCLSISGKNALLLTHVNEAAVAKKESTFRKELEARSKKGNKAAKEMLSLRKEYFARRGEFVGRRIWITFDKLYKAGDNGEYIYHYITENHPEIEIFYLIKDDSADYERLRDAGEKLLIFGQNETLLTVLYAETILTTHANIFSYTGFAKEWIPYIEDLFNPVNICIQHGLTVQNIAEYQYRWFDNLRLYLCASCNEVRNLERPIYDYKEGQICLTGLARYDGLIDHRKKQILITPTWRRNIANANIAHYKKGHNDYFKQSDYYKIYSKLIHDSKLISCARKYGYDLVYLLHPAASAQLEDFNGTDFVKIIPAAGNMNYEKILTESSLMVTDYSGVQFDFAYMRKVILYYHPKEIPPHYTESPTYCYETDACGPVIDNHEQLVDQLCEYMENGCNMKQEYIERANRLFAFNDHHNCERIYDTVKNFLDQLKEQTWNWKNY